MWLENWDGSELWEVIYYTISLAKRLTLIILEALAFQVL